MNDTCTYHLELGGQVDEDEINALTPFFMTRMDAGAAATLFAVHTDQSGLIGLLRHLHGLGLTLVCVRRVEP